MTIHFISHTQVTYTALMKGLCSEGRLADAFDMLSLVSSANIRTFHTLLRGAVREADGAFAQKMYLYIFALRFF
jgi:pentatricopeptide repeat protein